MSIFEQRANILVTTLQALYGNLFLDSMKGLTLGQVETVATGVMTTLSDDQFNRGMAMLNAKAGQGGYCPTIAEFKTWCMAGSWWTADEAWARVCDYTVKNSVKLTTLTKYAFDQVAYQITSGDMKGAQRQFKAVYVDLLSKAQLKGESQQWYEAPKQIAAKLQEQGKSLAEEKTTAQKVGFNSEQQQIMDLTKKLVEQGKTWKDAFDLAQVEVRGIVKKSWGAVA
ncbi:hypothetical protein B9T31_14995 [Acinetobacter sp. ANC 4558]|uniref:hypothetical protein n=1 Tax=Acinetobacter sp. ANC 4558 TaxID=1977876 RepID=UPI000A357C90|nr:hypothetical protein [Acinetobacter sp. ANC 4558]OTG81826.1 hypothetical protein B9T31_14995 [Acinetobacter sp. ANC 4558]